MKYVECFRCGDPIPSGAFAFKIIGHIYCTHCGQDELDYRYGVCVDDEDCDEDEARREENEYSEHCDECCEAERNREYGIDL